MLKQISWKQFIEVSVILVGIYYLVIFLLYYRKEIRGLFQTRRPAADPGEIPPAGVNEAPSDSMSAEHTPSEFLLTENIVFELKNVIGKVMQDGVEWGDLRGSIARVLKEHPELQNTPYGKAINNFIIRECGSSYAVRLDEREVIRLWGG